MVRPSTKRVFPALSKAKAASGVVAACVAGVNTSQLCCAAALVAVATLAIAPIENRALRLDTMMTSFLKL